MFDTMAAVARDAEYITFGETITVARSGSTSISLTMIRGEASSVGQDVNGVMVQAVSLAFHAKAADYTLGTPARGDIFTDSSARRYDVQGLAAEKVAETGEWIIPVMEIL
jgi:hypothetical protein